MGSEQCLVDLTFRGISEGIVFQHYSAAFMPFECITAI